MDMDFDVVGGIMLIGILGDLVKKMRKNVVKVRVKVGVK